MDRWLVQVAWRDEETGDEYTRQHAVKAYHCHEAVAIVAEGMTGLHTVNAHKLEEGEHDEQTTHGERAAGDEVARRARAETLPAPSE